MDAKDSPVSPVFREWEVGYADGTLRYRDRGFVRDFFHHVFCSSPEAHIQHYLIGRELGDQITMQDGRGGTSIGIVSFLETDRHPILERFRSFASQAQLDIREAREEDAEIEYEDVLRTLSPSDFLLRRGKIGFVVLPGETDVGRYGLPSTSAATFQIRRCPQRRSLWPGAYIDLLVYDLKQAEEVVQDHELIAD